MNAYQGRDPAGKPSAGRSFGRLLFAVALLVFGAGFLTWRVRTLPGPYRDAAPAPTPVAAAPQVQVAAPQDPDELFQPISFGNPFGRHFYFKIDPKTPAKDLLPEPPKARPTGRPVTGDDLAQVPEVDFQEPLKNESAKAAPKDENAPPDQAEADRQEIAVAYQIAKITILDSQKADGFLGALRDARPDLSGLPYVTGNARLSDAKRSKEFTRELRLLRLAHRSALPHFGGEDRDAAQQRPAHERFWARYASKNAREGNKSPVRVAVLTQVLAVEPSDLGPGLVKYLSGVDHVAATQALARLAIFSAEDEVRLAAVEALKDRHEADYTDVLLQGLHYPWPAVARRAADAAVRLGRTDLVPQLVDLLDEPDPRAPVVKESGGAKVSVVRELVRVNHHRNCLLCHPPGNSEDVDQTTPTAQVPLPCQPLPSVLGDYSQATAELLVRFDVTHLRQDFSVLQPVADAAPWPEMQRFDFLVRTRELTEAEAATYREAFAKPEPGRPSPYQRAALAALRELTGKDAEPTSRSWRRLLDLPQRSKTSGP